jgi:GrpB-like predicted nucleotidyltransferase (UPF0157 family)
MTRKAGFETTVRVVEHDPHWHGAFEAEAAAVAVALGAGCVRIAHVGSTSVPGLAGKPIIDMQVSLREVDVPDLERRLNPLGYFNVPWFGDADDYPFFAKPAEGERTHHLHACVAGSFEELRHVAVRDFLRAHPDEAAAYGAFKRDLAERCAGRRDGYVEGKDAFVKALETRALAWASNGSTAA